MTALVENIRRHAPSIDFPKLSSKHHRFLATSILLSCVLLVPESWHSVLEALSNAYLSVTVFVAGTLALVFGIERAFKTDLGVWLQNYKQWQVPVAALLGAFPGCGGAIIVMTQYTRGYMSFGAVVATLTATMGDAMFLLMAREPQTAIGILVLSLIVGIVSGYIIDAIHGPDFMRVSTRHENNLSQQTNDAKVTTLRASEKWWLMLMFPGLFVGILGAFQFDVDEWLAQWINITPAFWLGVSGSVLVFAMWLTNDDEPADKACNSREHCAQKSSFTQTIIQTSNYVSSWVIFSFVGYEVFIANSQFDLSQAFNVWTPFIPAIAVLIGLIPGCGPQILVTSLYVSGSLPLSAQIANAMANDGDALFPAIATAPKAALIASLYSAIPALISGYAWFILFE